MKELFRLGVTQGNSGGLAGPFLRPSEEMGGTKQLREEGWDTGPGGSCVCSLAGPAGLVAVNCTAQGGGIPAVFCWPQGRTYYCRGPQGSPRKTGCMSSRGEPSGRELPPWIPEQKPDLKQTVHRAKPAMCLTLALRILILNFLTFPQGSLDVLVLKCPGAQNYC